MVETGHHTARLARFIHQQIGTSRQTGPFSLLNRVTLKLECCTNRCLARAFKTCRHCGRKVVTYEVPLISYMKTAK